MATLTHQQWCEIRVLWEASPRQGIAWLTVKHGGPFEISEEAIRKRRLRDDWRKPDNLAVLASKAYLLADLELTPQPRMPEAGSETAHGPHSATYELGFDQPKKEALGDLKELGTLPGHLVVDGDAELLKRHRGEWGAVRALAYEAIQKRDFETAKLAKISSEILRNVQDGERKAYGLDTPGEGGRTIVIDRS
ncbi:hypothetical protein OL229_10765 [Neisseriaceae bacterium JH1-16]|nr:hypothetical protein [Neisseriaceae bacterium JH1-16]